MSTTCKARQYNDQMLCGRCGLQWDVGDPEPPACRADPVSLPIAAQHDLTLGYRVTAAMLRLERLVGQQRANREQLEADLAALREYIDWKGF